MTSFASANGPSVTFALPPGNETRAPIDGGCRPSPPSITPAFCSSSLYFIIAAPALASGSVPGFALSYPFGIMIIMNRMVLFSSWMGSATGTEIDTTQQDHRQKCDPDCEDGADHCRHL